MNSNDILFIKFSSVIIGIGLVMFFVWRYKENKKRKQWEKD